jgi:hypothetical protein
MQARTRGEQELPAKILILDFRRGAFDIALCFLQYSFGIFLSALPHQLKLSPLFFHCFGIHPEFDKFHSGLSDNRVKPEQKLCTHILQLLLPAAVGNGDNQDFAAQPAGNRIPTHAFAGRALPRSED